MGDRFATTDMGRKLGSVPIWGRGELGPHVTQCRLGHGLPPYQVASWSYQPFGHNRHDPKIGGGAVPLWEGGAGSPSNTVWPRPRPTSMPSFILSHSTAWPEYTNVWDRQTDRETWQTDNGPIA